MKKSVLYQLRSVYSFAPIFLDIVSPVKGIINWTDYFLDLVRLKHGRILTLMLKNKLKYKTRTRSLDKMVVVETNIRHIYSPPGFNINANDIVMDIGAHIGSFAVYAANLANKGKVYAVEPAKENYALLLDNIAQNGCTNVKHYQIAIGGITTERDFCLSASNTGGHSFEIQVGKCKEMIKTKVYSLSDFVITNKISRIDLLKMDTEGMEYEILFSTHDDILDRIRKIAMEYHQIDRNKNINALSDFLEKKGFKVVIRAIPFSTIGMLYASRP